MNKSKDERHYAYKSAIHSTNYEFDQELVVVKRLISIDLRCYENHYSWALVRRDQEEFHYAGLKFRELAIRNPRDHRAFNNLGISFAKQGKHDEAINAYKKSMEIQVNIDNLYNMAITFTQKGEHEQASEWFAKALKKSPSDEMIHNCLGYSYFLQGKYKSAIEKFDDAISHDARSCVAFFNKALALFCQNDLGGESEEVFRNGVLTLSEENQQKIQRLKSCIRLYDSELSKVKRDLESSGVTVERKDQLENLKRGFEYILDLLRKENEEVEKKLLTEHS